MLVTFKTKAYSNITMFGDVAVRLLKMMGHSGTVPSAMMAEDIPQALENLQQALDRIDPQPEVDGSDEEEPAISISNRAMPLIELFRAAEAQQAEVMWE